MYKFKSSEEEVRFNVTLNNCISDFVMSKTSRKKLQKIITCIVNTFKLSQLNHLKGKDHFFKNMNYLEKLNYDYLNCLFKNGFWEFTEDEYQWFNN